MPSDLEELVGFIAHPNPQIRLAAAENLVPYSTTEPAVFKTEQLKPVKHLKLLIRDVPKIAEHVLTILINLAGDPDVLEAVANDDTFIGVVMDHIVGQEEPNANLLAMLLANIAKWDGFKSVLGKTQTAPEALGSDNRIMNQLMDLFVKGQEMTYNKHANYDYLAYVFADLAKHVELRSYFVTKQGYDGVVPLSKLLVFTEHKSEVRRKGVASTIKNVAFDVESHPALMAEDGMNILPYVLLPITGNEEYDVEDSMDMLPDLQLLPSNKRRDADNSNVRTHIETLTLLATTREGRDTLRRIKVYPIVRETHLRVDDDGVREACERLVQILMRDEEVTENDVPNEGRVEEISDGEDDIVEV